LSNPILNKELDKILIVEDEVDLLEVYAETVGDLGPEVVTAANGQLALLQLEKMMPNVSLVLCDITMPTMNGLDFLRAAMAKYGYLPFVMLTAHSDHELTAQCLRLGAIDYMTKPFPYPALKEKLPFWIEIGKRQQALRADPRYEAIAKMESLMRVKNSRDKKPE
jgi:CheY-like chemotaxis protein